MEVVIGTEPAISWKPTLLLAIQPIVICAEFDLHFLFGEAQPRQFHGIHMECTIMIIVVLLLLAMTT